MLNSLHILALGTIFSKLPCLQFLAYLLGYISYKNFYSPTYSPIFTA